MQTVSGTTQADRAREFVKIASDARLEVMYESISRLWIKGGRVHDGLRRVMTIIEDAMDDRGMDTDGIMERIFA